MAVEETGMGVMEDKVIKNHYAAEYIYNKYKDMKTCGVIEDDAAMGFKKVAEPMGIVAAVIPTTNPAGEPHRIIADEYFSENDTFTQWVPTDPDQPGPAASEQLKPTVLS